MLSGTKASGDRRFGARRFRSTIYTIVLELVEHKFYYLGPFFSLLPLDMVDKSISPRQTHFGPVLVMR